MAEVHRIVGKATAVTYHHGGVDAGERAALQHEDLAARIPFLFGWCAKNGDGQTEVVRNRGGADSCPRRTCRDEVVSTGVADAGKRVIFGADCQMERARPDVTRPNLTVEM
jgi:hypothetical protein